LKLFCLQPPDENVDQVSAARGLEPALTQFLYELGCGNCLVIGADQDPGLGTKKSPRYILMELAKVIFQR
jgi:hypothetical protein